MKKIFFTLAMVMYLSGTSASAQPRCVGHHGGRPGYEQWGRHHRSPYFVGDNKVFFDVRKID